MVRVQDTPGYGDWENIQTHIDMVRAGPRPQGASLRASRPRRRP